jgi:hypothetical protein
MILIFAFQLAQASEADHGESNFEHYYGPTDPQIKVNLYNNSFMFSDQYDEEYYLNSKVQNELFYLKHFLDVELSIGLYCPEAELEKSEKYYAYLVRLLTISYLFEAMREYEFSATQMGEAGNCKVDWQKQFSMCRPKTNDMKAFLKNSKFILQTLEDVIVPFEVSTSSKKNEWIRNLKNGKFDSLSQYRISQTCKNRSCSDINISNVKKNINKVCKDDLSLFQSICSEEDSMYGGSYVSQVFPLLVRSSALRALNIKQYEKGCLRRYIEMNRKRERQYLPLKNIYSFFYSKFLNKGSQFERGRFFAVGALKEFQDKGLKNIFKEEVKRIKIASKKINTNRVEPVFEVITLTKFKKKAKVKPSKIAKKKAVIKKIKKSTFLIASIFRRKFELQKVDVDMDKLKYDYVFTLDQEKSFKPVVKKFSSQKSLKDMFTFDKLGSRKAPIPLKFVKFLIDKEMHQGLFNIIQVIGDTFFVKNDIDKNVKELEQIKIMNDQKTNFKWTIVIKKTEGLSTSKPEK